MNQHLHTSTGDYGGSVAEKYERFFVPAIGRPVADDLIEVAQPKLGERVLDVGCGTGVVTRLAAGRVGKSGTVAGVDVNPDMIEVARRNTPDAIPIDWYEASAESMPFPDASFDLVLCQMALQFIPDKLAALREMYRVLSPKGRLALNVPGPIPPPFADLAETLHREVGSDAAGFVQRVFSLNDEDELRQLLSSAGFRNIEAHASPKSLGVPAPRDFFWQYVHSTPLAASVLKTSDEDRSALENSVVSRWKRFAANGGMSFDVGVTTATAEK
jgi:ubiquinone/menaquinone biosynthesis C-methylase UbiE